MEAQRGPWAVSGCVLAVGNEECMGKQQGSSSGELCERFWKLVGCQVYALLQAVLVKWVERMEMRSSVAMEVPSRCGNRPLHGLLKMVE